MDAEIIRLRKMGLGIDLADLRYNLLNVDKYVKESLKEINKKEKK